MSRRTTALAAALAVLVLGSPLMTGCSAQPNVVEEVSNTAADLSSEDTLALNDRIAELTELIETNPQDAAAYNNRGNAKDDLGDTQGAIADYNKAIDINPQLADAYYNRGLSKGVSGDFQGSCFDIRNASLLRSQDAINTLLELKQMGLCQ